MNAGPCRDAGGRARRGLALACSIAALAGAPAGCALAPIDDPALYAAGWRVARVTDVGTGEALVSAEVGLCIGAHVWAPGQAAAVVRYTDGSRYHRNHVAMIVPVAPGTRPGDTLFVDVPACRAARELPAPPS